MKIFPVVFFLFVFSNSGFSQVNGCFEARSVSVGELANIYRISSVIYRSEQPRENDTKLLTNQGIKTAVNLRRRGNGRKYYKKSGVQMISVPMKAKNIEYKKVVEVLSIMKKSEDPLLIHCLHGSDRTGCIIACYRMAICGWDKDSAIKEFLDPRFGYHEGWFPGILEFLKNLDVEKLKNDLEFN